MRHLGVAQDVPKLQLPPSGKAQGVDDEGATAANNELIEVG